MFRVSTILRLVNAPQGKGTAGRRIVAPRLGSLHNNQRMARPIGAAAPLPSTLFDDVRDVGDHVIRSGGFPVGVRKEARSPSSSPGVSITSQQSVVPLIINNDPLATAREGAAQISLDAAP